MALVGKGSFIIGLLIAVGGGLGFEQAWFGWLLAVLGLIVGFLNISDKEASGLSLSGDRTDRSGKRRRSDPLHRRGGDPDHCESRAVPRGRGLGCRG